MSQKRTAYLQHWEESERGWGTRPDGWSLHLTEKDRVAFIDDYWKTMPKNVPEEYSRPATFAASANPSLIVVSESTYRKIIESKNGIRCFDPKMVNGEDVKTPKNQVEFSSIEHIKESMAKIRFYLCSYKRRDFCDCKFGATDVGNLSETGNGCPEIRVVETLLSKMTTAEFNKILNRKSKKKAKK